jgi:uncharacterized membrane protein
LADAADPVAVPACRAQPDRHSSIGRESAPSAENCDCRIDAPSVDDSGRALAVAGGPPAAPSPGPARRPAAKLATATSTNATLAKIQGPIVDGPASAANADPAASHRAVAAPPRGGRTRRANEFVARIGGIVGTRTQVDLGVVR